MAEEKKFLNEEMEKSNHKLMVKYIALSVVIFVILILCVLAWFSSKQEANASGLTIKATADNGLQVAITERKPDPNDGNKYKEVWTPYKYQQVYDSKFTSSEPLPLISGNGLRFFEPNFVKVAEDYTDKFDIDQFESDGNKVDWVDVTGNTNIVTGNKSKYIEYKLKFRNDKVSNVFLTGDSKVTPDSSDAYNPLSYKENPNQSKFSKNFISATARIAFLNKVTVDDTEKLNVHNLWIPNDDIELTHADKVESTDITYEKQNPQGTVKKVSGSSSGIPSGGTPIDKYYVWWNDTNTYTSEDHSAMFEYYKNMEQITLYEKDDYYYCKLTAPPCSEGYGDRAFYVTYMNTKDGTFKPDLEYESGGYNIKNKFDLTGEEKSITFTDKKGKIVTVRFMSNDYNLAYEPVGNGYNTILNCEKVHISPHEDPVDFYLKIEKNSNEEQKSGDVTDIIIDGGSIGSNTSYSVEINKGKDIYVPDNEDVLLISADNGSDNYGLSSTSDGTVSTESIGTNLSGADIPNWTVAGVNAEAGSFKLMNSKDLNSKGKYLSISSDASGLVLTEDSSDEGTDFYAVTKYEETVNGTATTTNLNGVLLYSLKYNRFLIFNGTSFQLSDTYVTQYKHSIYKKKEEKSITPASWGIRTPLTDPKSKKETQFFYRTVNPDNVPNTKKQQLASTEYILSEYWKNENDAIPSKYDSGESTTKHPNFIVSIDTSDGQGFFVSDEITVRIWGEGYDREAQTPLQGGKMQVDLHFLAVEKDKE